MYTYFSNVFHYFVYTIDIDIHLPQT